ncbi:MAG: hypothetical protein KF830_09680 [Planctomycetes bacterium]|nr:hypothetical protein [Planctomycetota bacterium]
MHRRLVALLFAAGVGLAQAPEPRAAPLDLEALAAKLDPGELPSVLAALPAERVDRLRRLATLLTEADTDLALSAGEVDGAAAAAAVAVLDAGSGPTAAGLWREILACSYFVRTDDERAVESALAQARGTVPWWHTAAAAAAARRRGLAARFLRQHADSTLLGTVLVGLAPWLPVAERAAVRSEALRRLGADADASTLSTCATSALRELDLDTAAALCDRAAAAPPPGILALRRSAAARLLLVRQRIAQARPLVEAARADGDAGRIARLRLLETCASDRVEAVARELVDADVAHALPFAMLAAHEAVRGRPAAGAALLQRAAGRPGVDATTAIATVLCRLMPLLARREESGSALEAVQQEFAELAAFVDAAAAADDSESAQVFRWLREHDLLVPSEEAMAAFRQALPSARELAAAMPESVQARWLLWTAAAVANDRAEANRVLAAPLPPALAGNHDLVRLRAELCVCDWLTGRGGTEAGLDAALRDLERVQQDGRDAAYLRGIVAWHAAARNHGDRERMRQARDHFAAAQRQVAERGWWRAASALVVVDLELGEPVDVQSLVARAPLRDGEDPHLGPSLMATLLLADDLDERDLGPLRAMLARIGQPHLLAVLHAAAAEGDARRDDPDGAARSARQAIEALGRIESYDLRPESGVASQGRLAWQFALDDWGLRFIVRLQRDLWALPLLPNLDRLRQIAAPK